MLDDIFKEEIISNVESNPFDFKTNTFTPVQNQDPFGLNKQTGLDFSFIANPTYFDPVSENFSKFKQSDYFNEKGFVAGRDNEQIYGERQTFGNKFVNGISGMADLAIYQFGDQLEGWGRMADALFSWDSSKLWGEDPEEAAKKFKEVVDKNGIFMTEQDRDSIFNWSKVFNTVQQAGFTIGAIAEIAAEELVTLGAATALQGTKFGRFMKALSSWEVDVNKMDRTLNETSKLRQWFKNISHNVESTPFVPFGGESLSFGAKAIGYGKKAGETGLEFAGRGFGAFYRDLRMFNSAATEARAEASGTYTDLKEKLINYELEKGNTLTYDKLQQIEELSKKAGQTNFLANTAIIGISDKIMFDGLFKSMKSAKGLLSQEGLIGSIRKGEGIEFFKRGFNLKTLKEGIRTKPLTYFKNNITEALQENLQDASNNAVQAYYESKYKNPGKQALQIGAYDAISQGLGTQFSKQGFETFLSGFATGAIVSPMLGGTKFLYNRATTTKEQRVEQDKRTNNDITQLQGLFSSAYAPAAGVSLSTAGLMQEAAKKNSIKDFQDAKDIQIREAAALLIRTNQTEKYFDLLEDQAQTLTQKEFEDAYGVDFKADNKNSAQDYINSFKQKVEEMDKLNRDFTYMFGSNPFKPSDEVNYTAWENAKWHTLYIKDAHSRAIQRSTELINSLPSKLQNLDVQSFLPLFDNKLFENEKKLLQEEIKAGVSPELTKDKIARLKILEKIEQQDSLSLNPEESYNEKLYEKYLLQVAKENKIDLTKEQIQDGLNNIRDIKNLRLDERNLLNNINWLVNPQNMSTLRQQHLEATQKMWEELTSKLTREEQKPTEETVEQPKQETTTEETAATFTPTTPYGTPTGETLITSTESIQTETKELPKEFFDEVLEQIFYKGIDFNNNQVNSVDDIERLFDKHSDIIVPLLKKYNVDPEDLFQKILEEEQLDESPILDNFKDNVNKVVNIKNKLEEILKQVEQTRELTKQQTSYLQNNKQIIDKVDLLKAMLDDIQDTIKPKEETKPETEPVQEDKPIEGLSEQETQTIVEYSSVARTRTNEAKDIPDKIDLPFNSVYDMTIGNMIRFINSSQGREYLETLGYKIVIQKITADFFNSHSPNPDFVTSERDPYNYFKKVENQGVTNYAFVLKDKNNQDVYINPNFFHDNSQPFTTQEGLKLAINLPKDSVTDEVELSWDDLVSKNGAIDQFKNGRLTPISEFLKGTDVEEQFSIVKGQKIGKYMIVKPNGVRQNGGLYLDLPNGYSIKLLPCSPTSINIQGNTVSLLDIVNKTYEPEQQTEMIDFLNKILIRDTGAVDEMFYRVVRNGNKIEIEAYKYTDRNEKGFGTNPVKQNLTTQQVAARIKNINILNIDFSVDRQITVPLLTKDSISFKQMSYLEFVQDNTYTSKKRYVNALTNKPQIQTIHDGFSVNENVLKAKIETTYQKELEKLFNCLS